MLAFLKNYLTQVSTLTGLLKLAVASGLMSAGVATGITPALLAIAGAIDVIRNERGRPSLNPVGK